MTHLFKKPKWILRYFLGKAEKTGIAKTLGDVVI